MWNKINSATGGLLSRFNSQRQSLFQQHEQHIQYASIGVSLLASVLAVLRTSRAMSSVSSKRNNEKNNFTFIALVSMFIAHSIAFGYQRLVLEPNNKMAGVGAAIAAMTAFIRAAMCMQERGQLAGMVVVAGGVIGCLYGMVSLKKDKVILEASRWMMAVCAPMVVLAKAPVLMAGHSDLLISSLQTGTTGLRLATFKRFQERGLYGYVLANFTACLAELLLALNTLVYSKSDGKQRRSSRRVTSAKKKQ